VKSYEIFWSLLNIFQSITIFLIIEFSFGASHKISFSNSKLRIVIPPYHFVICYWDILSLGLGRYGQLYIPLVLVIKLLSKYSFYVYIFCIIYPKKKCSDATYPFQLSKFTIGKLLQKYFCKKDTCDQNENIYIDWLVINSKFTKLKNCK